MNKDARALRDTYGITYTWALTLIGAHGLERATEIAASDRGRRRVEVREQLAAGLARADAEMATKPRPIHWDCVCCQAKNYAGGMVAGAETMILLRMVRHDGHRFEDMIGALCFEHRRVVEEKGTSGT